MKQTLYLLFVTSLCAASCVTFKQFDDKAKSARETSYEAAIIKEDGTVTRGNSLKHRNYDPYDHNLVRVTGSEKAFTIDGSTYSDKDVVCFQDRKAFHKRFNGAYLIRLVKGRMNLYYFDNTANYKNISYSATRTTAYFFEKENGVIMPIGLASLREAVKDNPAALAKLQAAYPHDKVTGELNVEKIAGVFYTYNQ